MGVDVELFQAEVKAPGTEEWFNITGWSPDIREMFYLMTPLLIVWMRLNCKAQADVPIQLQLFNNVFRIRVKDENGTIKDKPLEFQHGPVNDQPDFQEDIPPTYH